jgi:hypothetical protein
MKKLLILIAFVNILTLKASTNQKWEIVFDNVRGSVRNVQFFDNIVYLNSVPSIFKSTDNGKSFEELYLGTSGSMMSMYFINEQTGWAVRYGGIVVKTTDGGKTWFDQSLSNQIRLSFVLFIDENTGWITGSEGYLTKTTDGGISWTDIEFDTNANLNEIKIDSENNLWLIGSKTIDFQKNESYGVLYKSTDLGDTWTKIDVPEPESIYALEIVNNKIMLGSKNGKIYISEDNGDNWEIKITGIKTPIFDIKMMDNVTGYAAGGWSNGIATGVYAGDANLPRRVFKSESGGLQEMNSLSDITGNIANGAILFVTYDGGNSWEPYSWFKKLDHLFGITLHNGTIFVNGGNHGRVLKLIK